MSLVFGLCLSKKIYLVSDSRLMYPDGNYTDDFGKWLNLNPYLVVITAGNAYMASWMLRKIRELTGREWDFSELENFLQSNIEMLAMEFYRDTGRYGDSVGLIFGGFSRTEQLTVDAARLGEIMSIPTRMAGEGISTPQTIDPQILQALFNEMIRADVQGSTVGLGTSIVIDTPKPKIVSYYIKAGPLGVEIAKEEAPCYGGLVFNPRFQTERIILPDNLIGQLEYRSRAEETEEQSIYKDAGFVITYTKRLVRDRGWETVGGTILPILLTPEQSYVASGEYVYTPRETGIAEREGTQVIEGRVHYFDNDGRVHPYRFVYDYLENLEEGGNAEI